MTNQHRIRTNAEGIAVLRTYQQQASTEIRRALSCMADARYDKAYDTLEEAKMLVAALVDMMGQYGD